MIPYGRQSISDEDIDEVVRVLRSDFLTQGPAVPRFETVIADQCGVSGVAAVSSATAALHLACLALDVGPGDTVWTSPISFVASANCALYCGASVDFVDIDEQTGNMSTEALADKIRSAASTGRLPKVLIPVHLAGASPDLKAIHGLASQHGIRIIEDASHAIGATYRGRPVGSSEFSDATVFSFHPVKIITTGEGGAVATNDPDLDREVRLLRSHGITRDHDRFINEDRRKWVYEQQALGFNYRMTDIQAALGLSQFSRLSEFLQRRRLLASRYMEALVDLPLSLPPEDQLNDSAWHLFIVRTDERDELYRFLESHGVGTNVHYMPIYRQPYYEALGFQPRDFPQAEAYATSALSIPLFPGLGDDDHQRIVALVRKYFRG